MIKKARERVGKLYDLDRFEDVDERLTFIRHLLSNHTYSVRQRDREEPPEVGLYSSELPLHLACS